MAAYTNFYENLKEANIRLKNTIVLYDGIPYNVVAISNHKKDGLFRIYLRGLNADADKYPHDVGGYNSENPAIGPYLDEWMTKNLVEPCDPVVSPLIRKKMNSPLFNRFRPFPLGFCNMGGTALYLERSPQRPSTHQGLTKSMIAVSKPGGPSDRSSYFDPYSKDFTDCVMGNYPSFKDCVENLADETVSNDSAAFSRDFAIVRGPLGLLLLANKHEIVGILPNNDASQVRIGKKFKHVRESVEELGCFGSVVC